MSLSKSQSAWVWIPSLPPTAMWPYRSFYQFLSACFTCKTEIIIVTISWGLNEYVECLEQCLRHRKYSITLAVTGITHLSSIFYSEPDVGGMMLNNSWWWPSAHPLFNQGNREASTARIRSTKVGVLFSILLS